MATVLPAVPAVTGAQLGTYAKATKTDAAELDRTAALAVAMLNSKIDGADGTPGGQLYCDMPDTIYTQIVLEVGAELLKRRDSPSGSSQFADLSTGAPVRGPRDPFSQVWPILRNYVLAI